MCGTTSANDELAGDFGSGFDSTSIDGCIPGLPGTAISRNAGICHPGSVVLTIAGYSEGSGSSRLLVAYVTT
jgi:hypothetical protein